MEDQVTFKRLNPLLLFDENLDKLDIYIYIYHGLGKVCTFSYLIIIKKPTLSPTFSTTPTLNNLYIFPLFYFFNIFWSDRKVWKKRMTISPYEVDS